MGFRCPSRDCRKERSVFAGTFFFKTSLPINEIMHLAHIWLCKGSVSFAMSYTGHNFHTICDYYSYFQKLVADSLDPHELEIGGQDVIVELDESKFGKRKYNRGHQVDGVWVLGGVERTVERRVFLTPVPDRSAKTILEVLSKHILPGSIVYTDMWKGYDGIYEAFGLEHLVVNHSVEFVNKETGVHTNTIEGTWAGIKLRIPLRNRVLEGMTDHLFEFIWRRCHKNDLWAAFLNALCDVSFD
jgi:transposase-like protein